MYASGSKEKEGFGFTACLEGLSRFGDTPKGSVARDEGLQVVTTRPLDEGDNGI